MRRSFPILLASLVIFSMILAACSPAAAPATATAPAAEAPTAVEEVVEPTAEMATEAPTEVPTEAVVEEPTSEPESSEIELPEVIPAEVPAESITIAGSSTVYPVAEAIQSLFVDDGFTGEIKLDSIGSGAGFERFCKTGETDISNASRRIKDTEIENCQALSPARTPIEFRVGTDALAIVVSAENDFLTDVTREELAKIFSDQATTWADVNPDWPAEPIQRFAPGTDSGTYDFFIEVVSTPAFGDAETAEKAFLNADNLQASEDDNVLVQGVEGSPYAIGFFGYAYYAENEAGLNILNVDGVEPNFETAESGEYPLSRPLFIYSDAQIMKDKPQVAAFINFMLTNVDDVISEVGYFPASDEALNGARQAWLDAVAD
jgi:phosphate transport system substrate-binding protein